MRKALDRLETTVLIGSPVVIVTCDVRLAFSSPIPVVLWPFVWQGTTKNSLSINKELSCSVVDLGGTSGSGRRIQQMRTLSLSLSVLVISSL